MTEPTPIIHPHRLPRRSPRTAGQHLVWYLLTLAILLVACQPASPPSAPRPTRTPGGPIPTAMISVEVIGTTPEPTPIPNTLYAQLVTIPGDTGIQETLSTYNLAEQTDIDGSKADAYNTLLDFITPQGPYSGAWWFLDDGKADLYEIIAVVIFTEGDRNVRVQQAVAARYLWYCGGYGAACNGSNLINYLTYFQPWREPWAVGSRFTHPGARDFLPAATDLVQQRPNSIVTQWVPGADQYIAQPNNLFDSNSAINWNRTPFHFANVHPTWDAYLRETLNRGPDGSHRLWVLTIGDAQRVCRSEFICDNMTQEKTQ